MGMIGFVTVLYHSDHSCWLQMHFIWFQILEFSFFFCYLLFMFLYKLNLEWLQS